MLLIQPLTVCATSQQHKNIKQQKNQRRQNNDDLCVSAQIRKKIPNAHSSAHFPTHLCISRHFEVLRFIAALMCIYIVYFVLLDCNSLLIYTCHTI